MKNFPDWFFDKADWQEKTLGEVCSYISKRGTCSQTEYVGTENMLQNFSGVNFKDEIEKNFTGISYQVDDILFSNIRPYLKKVWKADKKGCASTDILVIRAEKNIFADFLYYSVANDEFISKVMTSAKGTKMPRGDKNFIMNLKIKFPPLAVQKKIAEYFTHLDNAINAQDLKLKSWCDAKKAMLQKIFSQEFYFTQGSGEKYPAWQEKTLGEIAEKIGSGKTPKGGEKVYQNSGIPFIRSQNIFNGELNFNDIAYISKKIDDEMKNSRVYESDILIVITGNVGRCCVYKRNLPANVSQHVCIVRLKENNSDFVANQILSNKIQSQIKKIQSGGTREGLNFQQVASLKIKIPCIEEQKKIAEYFSSFDKIIDAESKMLESLRQMKRGLLQKLFV